MNPVFVLPQLKHKNLVEPIELAQIYNIAKISTEHKRFLNIPKLKKHKVIYKAINPAPDLFIEDQSDT